MLLPPGKGGSKDFQDDPTGSTGTDPTESTTSNRLQIKPGLHPSNGSFAGPSMRSVKSLKDKAKGLFDNQADLFANHKRMMCRSPVGSARSIEPKAAKRDAERKSGFRDSVGAESWSPEEVSAYSSRRYSQASSKWESSRSSAWWKHHSDASHHSRQSEKVAFSLQEFLFSPFFEKLVGFIVLANFVSIVIETDARSVRQDAQPGSLHEEEANTTLQICGIVDTVFLVFYLADCALRYYYMGREFFHHRWNVFDLFVVISGLMSKLLALIITDSNGMMVLRFIRVLRLLRAFRIMTSFQELYVLVSGLTNCLNTLMWASFLIFLLLSSWSIVAVEYLHPYMADLTADNAYEQCDWCPGAFQSIVRANLTFFQVMTGDGWSHLCRPLIERHPWTALIMVSMIVTMVFGVLNLVTAVIVDTAAQARETDIMRLSARKIRERQEALELFEQLCTELDTDASGEIALDELKDGLLNSPQLAAYLSIMGVEESDLARVFDSLDEDGDGLVSHRDFAMQLYKMKTQEVPTVLSFVKQCVEDVQSKLQEFLEKQQQPTQKRGSLERKNSLLGPGPTVGMIDRTSSFGAGVPSSSSFGGREGRNSLLGAAGMTIQTVTPSARTIKTQLSDNFTPMGPIKSGYALGDDSTEADSFAMTSRDDMRAAELEEINRKQFQLNQEETKDRKSSVRLAPASELPIRGSTPVPWKSGNRESILKSGENFEGSKNPDKRTSILKSSNPDKRTSILKSKNERNSLEEPKQVCLMNSTGDNFFTPGIVDGDTSPDSSMYDLNALPMSHRRGSKADELRGSNDVDVQVLNDMYDVDGSLPIGDVNPPAWDGCNSDQSDGWSSLPGPSGGYHSAHSQDRLSHQHPGRSSGRESEVRIGPQESEMWCSAPARDSEVRRESEVVSNTVKSINLEPSTGSGQTLQIQSMTLSQIDSGGSSSTSYYCPRVDGSPGGGHESPHDAPPALARRGEEEV